MLNTKKNREEISEKSLLSGEFMFIQLRMNDFCFLHFLALKTIEASAMKEKSEKLLLHSNEKLKFNFPSLLKSFCLFSADLMGKIIKTEALYFIENFPSKIYEL